MNLLELFKPLNVNGRRFFITGGTGFLGRSLLDYLAEVASFYDPCDFKVTVLSRNPAKFFENFPEYRGHKWLSVVTGDLQLLPPLGNYTDVIHGAADTHWKGEELAWFEQLTDGTRRVLDFACDSGAHRFLFLSSGAVYGFQDPEVPSLKEDMCSAPLPSDIASIYGHGKRMAETLCALYTQQKGLHCIVARCFSVISRHVPMNGPYAVGNFLRDALATECGHINVQGDGTAIRTYLDGHEMAHWMFSLLDDCLPGETYNIGSDQPVTMLELSQKIAVQLAPHKTIRVNCAQNSTARSTYIPSVAKINSLGLIQKITLEQSIRLAAIRIMEKI